MKYFEIDNVVFCVEHINYMYIDRDDRRKLFIAFNRHIYNAILKGEEEAKWLYDEIKKKMDE